MDAIDIDLKGDEKFYIENCGGIRKKPILENIEYFYRKKVHLEVTDLIVPSKGREKEIKENCEFIASIDKDIPVHFLRFFPMYKLDYLPATDISALKKAKEIAKKAGLNYVYIGNLHDEENSCCKKCGNLLVRRISYSTTVEGMKGSRCSKCGSENNFSP